MCDPLVSVLMGIYNCESTLQESLDSITAQTYRHWELIMCDDGSTDATREVAATFVAKHPGRSMLLSNCENKGLAYSLNRCLELASGSYIARQDGDDVSLPDRFARQVDFLDNNPQHAVVSSPMILFDETGEWGRTLAIQAPSAQDFVHGSPFAHAPALIRRHAAQTVGGYRVTPRTLRVEDYDLWFRMYEAGFTGFNLQEPLYMMRDDRNAMRRRRLSYRLNEVWLRFDGFRRLGISLRHYPLVARPLLVGLLPYPLYFRWRRRRLQCLTRGDHSG